MSLGLHRPPSARAGWTAVVLTGGASRRMGRDKAGITVAGVTLLDRLLQCWESDVPVIVCGPKPDPAPPRYVVIVREEPPGGGPVSGIAAALPLVMTTVTAVVAVDLPFAGTLVAALSQELAGLLQRPVAGPDAVMPLDSHGVRQPLCAAYRTTALRDRVATLGEPVQGTALGSGHSVQELVAGLTVIESGLEVGRDYEVQDIDTPAELAHARGLVSWRMNDILNDMDNSGQITEWVAAVRSELGLTSDVSIDLVLDVAKDVAHGVERPAAPVTTYLFGCAVERGMDAREAAAKLGALAQVWAER